MPTFRFNAGIRGRPLTGFAMMGALLAPAVAATIFVVSDVSHHFRRGVEHRAPFAIASTQLVGNLYAALSTLRATGGRWRR